MNTAAELLELIIKYEKLIERANAALSSSFAITIAPLLAKRKGLVPSSGAFELDGEIIYFRFHGIGCRFEINGVIVEFDFTFWDFKYAGFESSKLFWFVQSDPRASQELKNRNIFDKALIFLEKNGNLIRANSDSVNTHDYILRK